MSPITIQTTLLDCGDGRVVIANDAAERTMVGVSTDGASFMQIDRVTMLELERGAIDLRTVLAERCAGIAVGA